MPWKNQLYFGDNLRILREHIEKNSVDLVYLDPPFNSNANYNVLFAEKSGEKSAAQIAAFTDTWHWCPDSEAAYTDVVLKQGKLSDLLSSFRSFLGTNDVMAYITMMAVRLRELHRVLKPTGSIYLHCDPTASHYLKLVMDAIFGISHFRNEIVWKRTSGRKGVTQYGRVHDIILFYSKGDESVWNAQTIKMTEENTRGHDIMKDTDGRPFRVSDFSGAGQGPSRNFGDQIIEPPPGRHWMFDQDGVDRLMEEGRIIFSAGGKPRLRTYVQDLDGIAIHDVWTDIEPLNSAAQERLGYPTQKPGALLERIINSSSNEGDVVMDPFCGCGTAIAVAEKLHRKWIGIDVTHLAITLIRHRLHNAFRTQLSPFEIIGAPTDLEGAKLLASDKDRYQFQYWALGLVDAKPQHDERKKGADKGIDGVIPFMDDSSGKLKKVIIQVKSGGVKRSDIATLKSDVDREKAQIGVFITMEHATRAMVEEAATAGSYEPLYGKPVPKIQILTIEDLLAGKRIEMPHYSPAESFKKAPQQKKENQPEQGSLL